MFEWLWSGSYYYAKHNKTIRADKNGNVYGGGGGGGDDTTVINQIPEPTAEERQLQEAQLELNRAQLAEMQRQSAYYEEMGPMMKEMYRVQAELAQQQAEYQSEFMPMLEKQFAQQSETQRLAMEQLTQALQPTEAELAGQELETELLRRQQAYLAGEAPELSAEQQMQLDRLSGLAQEEAMASIGQGVKTGLRGAQNIALARGLGSSSTHEQLQGDVFRQALAQAGEAGRGIEQMRFEAGWQIPRAEQMFRQGMGQFQSSVNAQAEANRQRLFASLASGGTGGIGTGLGGYGGGINLGGGGLSNVGGMNSQDMMNMRLGLPSGLGGGGQFISETTGSGGGGLGLDKNTLLAAGLGGAGYGALIAGLGAAAGPIGLAVGVGALGAGAIAHNWEGIEDKTKQLWSGIEDWF